MTYQKTIWQDGVTPLDAENLNKIEDAIESLFLRITEIIPKLTTITLSASSWVGSESLYSQTVDIPNVTATSKVDLTPTLEQLTDFYYKNVNFVAKNTAGQVTVYCVGQKPDKTYSIPAIISEVLLNE